MTIINVGQTSLMINKLGASLMSADLIHPNDAGHAVIAATILSVI